MTREQYCNQFSKSSVDSYTASQWDAGFALPSYPEHPEDKVSVLDPQTILPSNLALLSILVNGLKERMAN